MSSFDWAQGEKEKCKKCNSRELMKVKVMRTIEKFHLFAKSPFEVHGYIITAISLEFSCTCSSTSGVIINRHKNYCLLFAQYMLSQTISNCLLKPSLMVCFSFIVKIWAQISQVAAILCMHIH